MVQVKEEHQKALCNLVYRPNEPAFAPKGQIYYEIPASAMPDQYKGMGQDLETRFSETESDKVRVNVKELKWPDLSFAKSIRREDSFNIFFQPHIEVAGKLIEIFYKLESAEDLLACAVYARERVNPYLFVYCFSVAMANRDDTKDIVVPDALMSFPNKYIPKSTLAEAKELCYVVPGELRKPIVIPRNWTASDLDPEHKCAFFREDPAINLHHWHWHLVYPFSGPMEIVNKDRRGELFYFMHNQMINRYNCNRTCVGLHRIVPYNDFPNDIAEAYYPKLDNHNSSRMIIGRQRGYQWKTINGITSPALTVQDMVTCVERIKACITLGYCILPNGEKHHLTVENGIDGLGNMIESSILSCNSFFYGSLHNNGHMMFAQAADPAGVKYLEGNGVMADTATAMRDTVFYRWHKFIDDLFCDYKYTLPPYTEEELSCPGIKVDKVNLIVNQKYTQEVCTFWQWDDVNLALGLDFNGDGSHPVYVRYCHLNHEDFIYKINVTNSTDKPIKCTVRIFMFPFKNESGTEYVTDMYRRNAIEMDWTTATFPPGETKFFRSSKDSNVTIPFDRSFSTAWKQDAQTIRSMDASVCACGLPAHHLLPIGTPEGFPCQLFVMLTPYEKDKTNEDINVACNDNSVFCGIRDRKYPDKRAMGFPFDRVVPFATIKDFVNRDNMNLTDFKIRHKNIEIKGPHCSPDSTDY
ncbi:phenoloxidase 2-like [Lutzomyia longipalpis]|uniref:Putative prophenoloxidase 2 n=1 Tax=Lutzomyia longipalpis TaxID=7200 RepID=A0A1B0CW26_LUTLO|nr:phenoloxidase 2-like [Lutzomyia longipalpis]